MTVLGAPQADAAAKARQYLTFQSGGDTFAIAIDPIKEIIEDRHATEVPMMPAYVRGVINVRDRAVPVIDVSARFGRGRAERTRRTCIVILELEKGGAVSDIGLMVDSVSAVLGIEDADIEPPPSVGGRVCAEFIAGMGKMADRFAMILNVDRVLSEEEFSELTDLKTQEEQAA